jgi:hypothetical protein
MVVATQFCRRRGTRHRGGTLSRERPSTARPIGAVSGARNAGSGVLQKRRTGSVAQVRPARLLCGLPPWLHPLRCDRRCACERLRRGSPSWAAQTCSATAAGSCVKPACCHDLAGGSLASPTSAAWHRCRNSALHLVVCAGSRRRSICSSADLSESRHRDSAPPCMRGRVRDMPCRVC